MAEVAHAAPTEALLFVITCILIGISVKHFLSWLPIPYTAILLIIGLAIGLLQAANPATHAFTTTLSQWMNIDPHLLLLIFLPTIGFSAALGQEPHLLRKNWSQILLLAWPGVVVTFLLIAICAKYFFPYGWSWPQSLLFGAMLSATDPVAVVAVLQELGADEKLASVIDGESLVNDGSAFVIFLVLQRFVQGESLAAGQIIVLFLRLALVGAAIGFGFAVVTSLWLSRVFDDPGLEIVLTFGAAYSCYYVSEELCGASGLLAVVVMGFSMSLIGGRQITNRVKVEMHAFWEALEWVANTILFLWVGIALGLVLPPEPSHPSLQFSIRPSFHLAGGDAGLAVVLYLWLVVARLATIGLFYPLLRTGKVGYALNWRTALVVVWAGLRGAVGVSMSLFILLDPLIESEEYKAHCIFYMALMACTTVLINGSTTKLLLKSLGLLSMTPQQIQVLEHVLEEVEGVRKMHLQDLHPNPVLGAPDREMVASWTAVNTQSVLTNARKKLTRTHAVAELGLRSQGSAAATVTAAAASAAGGKGWRDLLTEYRARLLRVVKATYGDMYQHFELGTAEIGVLQEATDAALDAIHGEGHSKRPPEGMPATVDPERGGGLTGGLTDWEHLRGHLDKPGWVQKLNKSCGACCGAAKVLHLPQQQKASTKLVLLSAFVKAHTVAQDLLHEHLAELHDSSENSNSHSAHPADSASKTGSADSATGTTSAPDGQADDTVNDSEAATVCTSKPPAGIDGVGGAAGDDIQALQTVLQESQAEVTAALHYSHDVLLPEHSELASMVMSRHVCIRVLEEQVEFLEGMEAAGLIQGEEVGRVQSQLNQRLERLQHKRHWHLPESHSPPSDHWLLSTKAAVGRQTESTADNISAVREKARVDQQAAGVGHKAATRGQRQQEEDRDGSRVGAGSTASYRGFFTSLKQRRFARS